MITGPTGDPQDLGRRAMMIETGSLGLTEEELQDVLGAAARAPSLHNTQPWLFRLVPDGIELHADLGRRLPVADPSGRELRLACGAALFNLRLALIGHGVRPLVTLLPDPARPDLVAVVRRGGSRPPTPEQRRLLEAVPRRRTNRRPFTDALVPTPARHALRRAALDEGAWLDLVTDPVQRVELGALARRAHERQMADPEFVAELERWTGYGEERTDGVPAAAGGPLPGPNATWVLRDFSGGTARAADGVEAEPLIAVLSAHSDGPREEVRAGHAMQRVLLTATAHGLAVSFLSQLVECPDVREALRRLIGGARPPQVVLRIGQGWPVPGTPRRPLTELLLPPADGPGAGELPGDAPLHADDGPGPGSTDHHT
ncbi:nitroreductase [Pseudonocardia kujensis]|uniref:Acg family FMN-binding oxidoreductase n=1 Tax=Pseudonocardia kujensis TaxID=1128675 RepID=UPI001E318B0A|nr:nitroreductase [Pseudonocardia kujensis]MCE0764452.1 nitroreductase [Pseudonocardia kujensis]